LAASTFPDFRRQLAEGLDRLRSDIPRHVARPWDDPHEIDPRVANRVEAPVASSIGPAMPKR